MPLGLGPGCSAPAPRTAPRSARSKPAMMFISVDLPQPDGPTIATNSPSSMLKLTSSMTGSARPFDAKLLVTPSTTIFLPDIAPSHGLQPLQQARGAIEHQADQPNDDHAGDHQ